MEDKLTKGQTGLVAAIDEHGLGEMIKPLIKEIHLFDTYVAGVTHLEDPSVLDEIGKGDVLKLQREDNAYDANAIMLISEKGKKAGYVPAKDNIIFARLMDAGKMLRARIDTIEKKGKYTKIDLKIYLVDF